MDSFHHKSGCKVPAEVLTTPKGRNRPRPPTSLLNQTADEQYIKGLMANLSGYLTTTEPSYSSLHNLLLPKDVNYYYTERTQVTARIDEAFNTQKRSLDELFDDFLKRVIVVAETAKSAICEVIDTDRRTYQDFYSRFTNRVQAFLEQSSRKIDGSLQEPRMQTTNT